MSSNDIHDHSTWKGKFHKLLASLNWKKVLGIIVLALLIALAGTVIGGEVLQAEGIADINDFQLSNGSFVFDGNKTTFPSFPGFSVDVLSNPPSVTSISLRYVTIDAVSFSGTLRNFTSIVSIDLDQVYITDNFQRILLPNLKEFRIQELIQGTMELATYQNNMTLYSRLFFNLASAMNWELDDVCNLGVDILYAVNGTKLLTVDNQDKMIEMNIPYCQDILKNVTMPYESLALANCTADDSVIPANLKYLNLFNVTFEKGNLGNLLKKLTQLEHLYLFLPNTTLDLAEIPTTITQLSLSGVTITSSKDNLILPNLTTLNIANSFISAEVYKRLNAIFPSLKRIAAFGFQTANFQFLSILMNEDIWILIEDFNRIKTTKQDPETERKLADLGISTNETNFVITPPTRFSSMQGVSLNEEQALEYRYNLFGFNKFLTFDEFRIETGNFD